jgi:glycosyltransferase involved in cell wall biosynthesis
VSKLLSVVIPALNSAGTISDTLSSIFSNETVGERFEVLLVDNGSCDETVEIARRFPVKIFHCSRRGIGPPRNLGIQKARGDIVIFTDSDCIVEKDWITKIFTFFSRHSEADGVGGPVFPYPCCENRIQELTGKLFVEDQGYPRRIRKIQRGSTQGLIFGSNSAYKRSVLVKSGGFIEPGGSNLELALRLVASGKNLFFYPGIVVYHVFPSDLRSIFRQQFRWGAQSTHMKRMHHFDKGAREIVYISYFPVRRLLSLVFPVDLEKKLLHFTQVASYGLGRVYGFQLES